MAENLQIENFEDLVESVSIITDQAKKMFLILKHKQLVQNRIEENNDPREDIAYVLGVDKKAIIMNFKAKKPTTIVKKYINNRYKKMD